MPSSSAGGETSIAAVQRRRTQLDLHQHYVVQPADDKPADHLEALIKQKPVGHNMICDLNDREDDMTEKLRAEIMSGKDAGLALRREILQRP